MKKYTKRYVSLYWKSIIWHQYHRHSACEVKYFFLCEIDIFQLSQVESWITFHHSYIESHRCFWNMKTIQICILFCSTNIFIFHIKIKTSRVGLFLTSLNHSLIKMTEPLERKVGLFYARILHVWMSLTHVCKKVFLCSWKFLILFYITNNKVFCTIETSKSKLN